MSLSRGLLTPAIIAALWWAPWSVSAAVNRLSSPDVPRDTGSVRTDELVSDVLVLGLAGVASVAVVGTLRLVAGRRRGPERARANAAPENAAPSVAKDAALRRIAREDRGRDAGDPIVAALGIDDKMAARRAIRRSLRETPDGDRHPANRPGER